MERRHAIGTEDGGGTVWRVFEATEVSKLPYPRSEPTRNILDVHCSSILKGGAFGVHGAAAAAAGVHVRD